MGVLAKAKNVGLRNVVKKLIKLTRVITIVSRLPVTAMMTTQTHLRTNHTRALTQKTIITAGFLSKDLTMN